MKKIFLFAIAIISIMLIASCASLTSSSESDPPPTPQNETEKALQTVYERYVETLILTGASNYTVKSGDTLSNIARDQYKNGFYYPVIMLASNNVVLDPDKIEPGMRLTIPDLQRNLNDAGARSKIKEYLLEIADVEQKRNRADTATGIRNQANSL